MTEEPYTPPKRLLIVNRRIEAERNKEHPRFHDGTVDATIVESAAEAEKVLKENANQPFDWVILRKNIGEHSGEFEDSEKDRGIAILRDIYAGKYGDYSRSRIALITNAMESISDLLYNEDTRYAESIVRLYKNLAPYPEVDCLASHQTTTYINNVLANDPQKDWHLPNMETLREMLPQPTSAGVHSATLETRDQSLEISASKISR